MTEFTNKNKRSQIPLDLLKTRLSTLDVTEIAELLHISSEDLINKFKSRIVQYKEHIASELDLDIEQAFSSEDDNIFENYDEINVDDFINVSIEEE